MKFYLHGTLGYDQGTLVAARDGRVQQQQLFRSRRLEMMRDGLVQQQQQLLYRSGRFEMARIGLVQQQLLFRSGRFEMARDGLVQQQQLLFRSQRLEMLVTSLSFVVTSEGIVAVVQDDSKRVSSPGSPSLIPSQYPTLL